MILILMINCSPDLDHHRSSIVLVYLVGELASSPVEEYRVEDCQDCLLGLIFIMIMIRKNQYHNDIDNDDNDENHDYEIITITTCHPSTASSNTWLLQK